MVKQNEKSGGLLAFIKERGRTWLLLLCGLLGVVLLLFGGGKETAEAKTDALELRVAELSAYEEKLEKEIKALCESVAGVGDTDVMISFSSGYSVTYVGEGRNDGTPATVGTGSSEEALFRYISPPTVRGVGIVCRGGQRADVQQRLTELVSTALGIPSSFVYITGK